jgi:DNA excision repair protein ERCC-2
MKDNDADKLKDEYSKLVEGLRDADEAREEDAFMSNPGQPLLRIIHNVITEDSIALPDDLLKEAVPGNIRRAEHFVAFLKRFVEYLKVFYSHCS